VTEIAATFDQASPSTPSSVINACTTTFPAQVVPASKLADRLGH
jgi:hypothetical protein